MHWRRLETGQTAGQRSNGQPLLPGLSDHLTQSLMYPPVSRMKSKLGSPAHGAAVRVSPAAAHSTENRPQPWWERAHMLFRSPAMSPSSP